MSRGLKLEKPDEPIPHPNIVLTQANEKKFFKLLVSLCKNCEENTRFLKYNKEIFKEYNAEVIQHCDDYREENNEEMFKHYNEVKEKLKALSNHMDWKRRHKNYEKR